eukprot:6176248-Pleurochrysis_carterae.AAC.1
MDLVPSTRHSSTDLSAAGKPPCCSGTRVIVDTKLIAGCSGAIWAAPPRVARGGVPPQLSDRGAFSLGLGHFGIVVPPTC